MGPKSYPERSVINNHYLLRNKPEERNSSSPLFQNLVYGRTVGSL